MTNTTLWQDMSAISRFYTFIFTNPDEDLN